MRHLRADQIFPIDSPSITDGVVSIDENGVILSVKPYVEFQKHTSTEPEYFQGTIVPGFINAHCHLELSHLRGKLKEHTGLVDFIIDVQQFRNTNLDEIADAMINAENEMLNNGIVAVGDISNTSNSASIKSKSKLYYHTFIELLGFEPKRASDIFKKGQELQAAFNNQASSITIHAPYSSSTELLKMVGDNNPLSIHFRESAEELKFLSNKEGDFLKLYKTFGIDIDFFEPRQNESLKTYLSNINKTNKIQFVHNTFFPPADYDEIDERMYWCFCPGANQYIEGHLPEIDKFLPFSDRITLGTDSLASNNKLDILAEIKLIDNAFPQIGLQELLKWATLNGAKFLGIDKQYGSITKGKKPGLNLISADSPVRVLKP